MNFDDVKLSALDELLEEFSAYVNALGIHININLDDMVDPEKDDNKNFEEITVVKSLPPSDK